MKTSFILAIFLFAANFVFAAEVGLDQAKSFARGWRGKNVSAARTHKSAAGESRFHVVSFEGGGWAAVGVDDEESPVIAFSDNGEELVEDEKNPVWFLVKRDAEWRAKGREIGHKEHKGHRGKHKGWERKKVEGGRLKKEGTGSLKTATVKTSVSEEALEDVRVAPLLKSTWNQKTANNYANGPLCYNYYTPNNYYCGCVATMMAQMMRYFEWPNTNVTAKTYSCMWGSDINTASTMTTGNKTMKGGIYDWEKMTLEPDESTLDENRQEIGKLCYDCGVSVNMMWSGTGSGACTTDVREALIDTFGYSNAASVMYGHVEDKNGKVYMDRDFDPEEFKTIVISNCEAGLPVGYGISGKSGGHAVVIDGYGFSGQSFFVHINPGWGGGANAWYSPPDLTMKTNSQTFYFDSSDELVYNVFTNGVGSIVTGRVVDTHGNPIEGALISAIASGGGSTAAIESVYTDNQGRYHFVTGITGSNGVALQVTASKDGRSALNATQLKPDISVNGRFEPNWQAVYSSVSQYSLGNKIDFDIILDVRKAPKVLFR